MEQIVREVDFTAIRSRGPGGQNVNKVSSAALLYWCPEVSSALLQDQRLLLLPKLRHSLNKENMLLVRSDEYRDLPRNKARCLEKLFDLINSLLHKPKIRRATKPTRSSRERKLKSKAIRAEIKKGRGKVHHGD